MKKFKQMFRIYAFLNLLIVLIQATNSTYAQCSEFMIKEYENIVNIPFSVPKLNAFVSKKGYQAVIIKSDYENVYIQCKNGNLFDYFKIDKNQSILIENVSVSYRENFIKKISKEGYNITLESKQYRSVTYSKGNYEIIIMRDPLGTDYIINISKGEAIQQIKQEVIKEESNHTAQYYAKKISQNSLEINSYTNATDIKFKKGDKIYIKASGYISLGIFAGSTGPNGIDGYTEYSILKGLRHGCLMASIGNNEWFPVGESSSFTADKDGYLSFKVNDKDGANNNGNFIVEYGINKPLNSTPPKPSVTTPTRTQSNEQTYTQPVTEPARTSTPPMTDEQLQNALKKYGKISEEESIEEAEKFGLSYVKRYYNLQKLPKSKPFYLQPESSWEGYIYGIEKDKLEMTLSLQKSNSNYDKEYPLVTGMIYISQSNKKFIRFKIYGYVENNTINFFFDEIKGNTLKVNVFCKLNLKGEYLNGGIRGSSISGSWENYNGQYLKTYSSDKEKGETKCGNGSFYLSEKK